MAVRRRRRSRPDLSPATWSRDAFKGGASTAVVLGSGPQQVQLLGRDGWLWLLDPNQAGSLDEDRIQFRPYSPSVLRNELLREVGRDYEVSGTGHYLIIHPRGQRDKWAERFENLYRSFVHYFSVRGFEPANAGVSAGGLRLQGSQRVRSPCGERRTVCRNGVVGYYSGVSNRITLYDMGGAATRPIGRKTPRC